uniref:Uncharacterized protein n=1 Tax=Knipowitschia caucasica TaxID=637954 RepID=A0AAV2MA99_KNICA
MDLGSDGGLLEDVWALTDSEEPCGQAEGYGQERSDEHASNNRAVHRDTCRDMQPTSGCCNITQWLCGRGPNILSGGVPHTLHTCQGPASHQHLSAASSLRQQGRR